MPHMFLQWASKFNKDPFDQNWTIINKGNNYKFARGYVYWGKFNKQMDVKGVPDDLESYYGESYGKETGVEISKDLNADILSGNPVYLYLYNPIASADKLQVANVLEVFYTDGSLPPADEDDRPACSHIPSYYFHQKLIEKCPDCRMIKTACKMKFICNFWFKVDAFMTIKEDRIQWETESNLTYAGGQVAKIGTDFSLTKGQVFPILVNQKQNRDYFKPFDVSKLLPMRQENQFKPHYKKGHKGEKYGHELQNFLKKLWDKVRSINKIQIVGESHGIQKSYFKPYKQKSDDWSIIEGGREFRSGKKNWTIVFLLYTTCKNSKDQSQLAGYLHQQFADGPAARKNEDSDDD